jgi:hypothetical protein
MNRVFSSLVLTFVLLGAAALPACTAAVLDEDACAASCPDTDETTGAPTVRPPDLKTQAIVVPQSPKSPSGAAAVADAGAK